MSDERVVIISLGCSLAIKVDELWPDGDAPRVVTADAVKSRLESEGGKSEVLRDWDLIGALDVHVDVTDGPAGVRPRLTSAQVW